MEVKIKLVVFEHPDRLHFARYCSYSPETKFFSGRGETIAEVLQKVKNNLLWELGLRNISINLSNRNWQISENSAIPPTFTDEEAIELTKKSYELQQLEHVEIFVINVEVPKAKTHR